MHWYIIWSCVLSITSILDCDDVSVDLTRAETEFAVAYWRFYDDRYDEASRAVIRYIENRSDYTFIGDPLPHDVSEILRELNDKEIISSDR